RVVPDAACWVVIPSALLPRARAAACDSHSAPPESTASADRGRKAEVPEKSRQKKPLARACVAGPAVAVSAPEAGRTPRSYAGSSVSGRPSAIARQRVCTGRLAAALP